MKTFERMFALIVLFCAPAWTADGEADKDAEIARLKQELQDLRGKDATRLDEEIAAYLETTGEEVEPRLPSYRSPQQFGGRVRFGGYLSLEFRDDDQDVSRFDLHRLVLRINADIADNINFDSEIEIEGGGADVGFLTGNEILVEYAEIRYGLVGDALTFKVGALLVPWGRFNRYHDDPYQDLTDRPLVSRYLGAVAFDQPGVGFEGSIDIGDSDWWIDYDTALTQGFGESFTTSSGARSARQSFREDNNQNKQLWARVVVNVPLVILDVLEIGGSGTYGKWDSANNNADYGYGVEIFLKRGPFELVGEYMNLRIEQDAGAPITDPQRMDGWYVEAAYHFFPSSWRGAHPLLTDESTFTFILRFEEIDLNHATTGTTFRDDLQRITIGFNFRPVERNVFKISYAFVDSKESGSGYEFVISWATYF
jgi:hypothetical protein